MALIDVLKKRIDFSYEGKKIKVKPLDRHDFQTYPIDKDYILVSEEELIGLATRLYQFNEDLNGVEPTSI